MLLINIFWEFIDKRNEGKLLIIFLSIKHYNFAVMEGAIFVIILPLGCLNLYVFQYIIERAEKFFASAD